VAERITDLVAARNPEAATKEQFQLQPLSSIHLHSNLMNEASANGSATWVYVLLAVIPWLLLIMLPVGGVFALVLLTVGLQAGRAARASPVDSLRYE
jgi:hypothetical protein